jgi:hypothetical protein
MALVVDASALASAALSGDTSAPLRQRLRDELVHAPHLIDAELGSVLRRHSCAVILPPITPPRFALGAAADRPPATVCAGRRG